MTDSSHEKFLINRKNRKTSEFIGLYLRVTACIQGYFRPV